MGGGTDESPKRAIEWPKWRDIARMIIAPISSPLRGGGVERLWARERGREEEGRR